MNEVLKTIKSRRSVRNYKQEQISQELLDQIIEAGVYAPTAMNDQPWHFTVIQNQELLKHINQKAKEAMIKSDSEWVRTMGSKADFNVMYNAPTLIVVSGRKTALAWNVDCAAAIQNMLIAAESLGIGSVWLGLVRYFFQQEEEVGKLELPEGYQPFYGVAFGYNANESAARAPKRNMDVVNYIREL